jgi:tetratricopeptide (TPR) repeat protein
MKAYLPLLLLLLALSAALLARAPLMENAIYRNHGHFPLSTGSIPGDQGLQAVTVEGMRAALEMIPAEAQTYQDHILLGLLALQDGEPELLKTEWAFLVEDQRATLSRLHFFNQGYRCESNEDLECAMRYYRLAFDLSGLPEAALGLGKLERRDEQYAAAIKHLEAGLLAEPDYATEATLHKELGLALREIGQNKQAIEQLETAIQMGHDEVWIRISLARIYLELGDSAGAFAHAQAAATIAPTEANAHKVLGDVYKAQGALQEAIKAYCISYQIRPDTDIIRRLENLNSAPIKACKSCCLPSP